jgi:uncharacterized protein YfaS (alpha-2-macroglobulin family)
MTEQPSAVMSGTVERVIISPLPSAPEKAQITVEGADRRYEHIRFENTLTDENGQEVGLKQGAKVRVTVRSRAAGTRCRK